MPYEFYKLAHYLGLALSLLGLGAIWAHSVKSPQDKRPSWMAAVHGLGLLLLLIAGFGLLARIGEHSFPLWVWLKIAVWLIIGGSPVLFRRKPQWALFLGITAAVLVTLAGWIAIFKP